MLGFAASQQVEIGSVQNQEFSHRGRIVCCWLVVEAIDQVCKTNYLDNGHERGAIMHESVGLSTNRRG
jgi:hypothetical protein